MKINEVEQQAGITKRNIRFYEQQGLLSPKRNGENGYRDYSEEDVAELKKIKLLRKLSLPIEDPERSTCSGRRPDASGHRTGAGKDGSGGDVQTLPQPQRGALSVSYPFA